MVVFSKKRLERHASKLRVYHHRVNGVRVSCKQLTRRMRQRMDGASDAPRMAHPDTYKRRYAGADTARGCCRTRSAVPLQAADVYTDVITKRRVP